MVGIYPAFTFCMYKNSSVAPVQAGGVKKKEFVVLLLQLGDIPCGFEHHVKDSRS